MKALTISLLAILFIGSVFAQSQKGYVRTSGTSKHKGKPLSGVVIQPAGGSSVLSDGNGQFIMSLPGINTDGVGFYITKVKKKGYELLDKDLLREKFVFSNSVPVEIILISTSELQKIKQDIEYRARHNAKKHFDTKIKSLKKQLKNQKITIGNYQDSIIKLEKQMESFESLISVMAERYARTDYDRLDSLNKIIIRCIENGELEKADSLIDTKGNVRTRALQNIKNGQIINMAETQLDSTRQLIKVQKEILREKKTSKH